MTFGELYLEVSRNVWPEGEARNLRPLHKKIMVDALIDLQKKIECLQTKNIENIGHDATFFYCGSSAFGAPEGFVKNLRTIPDLLHTRDWRQCDVVWAQPMSRQTFECKLETASRCGDSLMGCGCATPITMPYGYYANYGYEMVYPYHELPIGLMFPDALTDKACRARERWFAMWNRYIYTYPVIQSNELLILEWQGIKRNWQDDSIIPYLDEAGDVDRQVVLAIEHFLLTEKAKRDDCDNATTTLMRTEYNRIVAELIWQCREEGMIPSREHCFVDCNC